MLLTVTDILPLSSGISLSSLLISDISLNTSSSKATILQLTSFNKDDGPGTSNQNKHLNIYLFLILTVSCLFLGSNDTLNIATNIIL